MELEEYVRIVRNGPLHGTPSQLNLLVLANDPVEAGPTRAPFTGTDFEGIPDIQKAAILRGSAYRRKILRLVQLKPHRERPFQVLPARVALLSWTPVQRPPNRGTAAR